MELEGSTENDHNIGNGNQKASPVMVEKSNEEEEVAVVIAVPLPAQGHLNQMLQLSCLISSYGIPVYYVASAIHNRQARIRVSGLNSANLDKIHFHDIHPTLPFASPPPDPNSSTKFPFQLQPLLDATLSMRRPVADYMRHMSNKYRRVVVVHDYSMGVAVQDVASIRNAESYSLNCLSALSMAYFWGQLGKEIPEIQELRELPSIDEVLPKDAMNYAYEKADALKHRAGDIYNTCRLLEAPYLDLLGSEGKMYWAIGPMLPTNFTSSDGPERTQRRHKCLEWLDQHERDSVIYISFGTTVSLSKAEVKELAQGLENSKVRFVWVLRDADTADIFNGEARRVELPEGFEERTKDVGIVVREWAPQIEILAHQSTGGFMSHCGWNSTIESISMGVPIAAWPMHSDQPVNAMLITKMLKTGFLVKGWIPTKERPVEASAVESAIRRLMASEEGDEFRKSAEELAAKLREATQPGGASRLELDSLIAHITR